MTKPKTIFLIIVALACSTYGGIKGYIYYKVKVQVDNLVMMAIPFAMIDYGGISSSLNGSVILEQINFQPNDFNDSVKIDELKFILPDINAVLHGSKSIIRGEFPEKMEISIRGARLNLIGDLASAMVQAETENLGYRPSNVLACTFSQDFLTEQYRELGIDELILDTRISMKRSNNAKSIAFKIHFGLRGIEEMSINFTVEDPQNIVTGLVSGRQFSPPLKSISIDYRPDPAFNQHTARYCADLMGVSTDEFIKQLVNQDDKDYMNDLGFVPGPGIRSALKSILTDSSEVRIVALPGESLDLSTLHLYNPKDIPDLLELVVTVDDKIIDDLSFTQPALSNSMRKGKEKRESASVKFPILNMIRHSSKDEDPPEIKQEEAEEEKSPPKEFKYHTVKASDLKVKIGREAYIITNDGKARGGIIASVENDIISLQIRMHGGTVTTHVPIKEASKIEVQEWVTVNK